MNSFMNPQRGHTESGQPDKPWSFIECEKVILIIIPNELCFTSTLLRHFADKIINCDKYRYILLSFLLM